MSLRTDYTDDVLDTSANTQRKYYLVKNSDGTYSFSDQTVYTSEGDYFGAEDINATNSYVNELVGDWSLEGYVNKETVFNSDDTITETNSTLGYSEKTTFNADGSITQEKFDSEGELLATMTTTFNADGSISQEVVWED